MELPDHPGIMAGVAGNVACATCGTWCQTVERRNQTLVIFGQVAGGGLAAAGTIALLKLFFRGWEGELVDPLPVLEATTEVVRQACRQQQSVNVLLASWQAGQDAIRLAAAGGIIAIHRATNGSTAALPLASEPLSDRRAEASAMATVQTSFAPGDRLVLTSPPRATSAAAAIAASIAAVVRSAALHPEVVAQQVAAAGAYDLVLALSRVMPLP
jgi:hypothetical protein